MKIKQYLNLLTPLNRDQFSWIFISMLIFSWLVRSCFVLLGIVTSMTGLWVISVPLIYILAIAYVKRIQDIKIIHSPIKLLVVLTTWFVLGCYIHFIFLSKSAFLLEELKQGMVSLPLSLDNPYTYWAICSGIINLPIAVLSSYLVLKKSKQHN